MRCSWRVGRHVERGRPHNPHRRVGLALTSNQSRTAICHRGCHQRIANCRHWAHRCALTSRAGVTPSPRAERHGQWSSQNTEVPERCLDGSPPLGRTGISARGAATVVGVPKREAVELLDVGDPARPGAEAVTGIDASPDHGIGDPTRIRASWLTLPPKANRRPLLWFHVVPTHAASSALRRRSWSSPPP